MNTKQFNLVIIYLFLILILNFTSLYAQSNLEEILNQAVELPEEQEKIIQIQNKDVVAYFDLTDINTPLQLKNFRGSTEYNDLLAELQLVYDQYHTNAVYTRTSFFFGEYNLKTRKIQAPIDCPADLLGRSTYSSTLSYFDDGKVFGGVTWNSLPIVLLPFSERSIGIAWYAVNLQINETEAIKMEKNVSMHILSDE